MPRSARLDPAAFMLAYGASRVSTLRPPERTVEEIEAARRAARGDARRQATRELALAHMLAAERAGDEREARRHRRDARSLADQAASGNRDEYLAAEMAFVRVFCDWRAGSRAAARTAERFTTRYRNSGDLLILAWLVRGEIAFEKERWEDAATAYRYVLGMIDHPLYAFALYRTAESYQNAGRGDDARQALTEVRQLGCATDVAPEAKEMAERAARKLGTGMRQDPDGVSRFETCPVPTAVEP